MSWTYEPGASNKDTVRLLIGDTDETKRQLHDEEIAWFLGANGSIYVAASEAAKAIAALYGRDVDKQVGDLRISASQRQKQYLELAKHLRSRAGTSVSPYAGGISRNDKQTVVANTDRVEPAFERGQFDNVGTTDPRASSST